MGRFKGITWFFLVLAVISGLYTILLHGILRWSLDSCISVGFISLVAVLSIIADLYHDEKPVRAKTIEVLRNCSVHTYLLVLAALHNFYSTLYIVCVAALLFSGYWLLQKKLVTNHHRHLQHLLDSRPELTDEEIYAQSFTESSIDPERIRTTWHEIAEILQVAPGKLRSDDSLISLNGISLFIAGWVGVMAILNRRYQPIGKKIGKHLNAFRTLGALTQYMAKYGYQLAEGVGEPAA